MIPLLFNPVDVGLCQQQFDRRDFTRLFILAIPQLLRKLSSSSLDFHTKSTVYSSMLPSRPDSFHITFVNTYQGPPFPGRLLEEAERDVVSGGRAKQSTIDEGENWEILVESHTCEFNTLAIKWIEQDGSELSSNHLIGICFDSSFSRGDYTSQAFPCMYALPRRNQEKDHASLEWHNSNATYQKKLPSKFQTDVRSEDVRVLLMAYSPATNQGLNLAFGLIIIRLPNTTGSEIDSWQRVGLCFWVFDIDTSASQIGQFESREMIEEACFRGAFAVSKKWELIRGNFR